MSLYSPGTSQTRAYRIHVLENQDDGNLNSLNYYGTNAKYANSADGGNSWNSFGNKDISFKLNFSQQPTGYKQSGILYSSAYNVSSGILNAISWSGNIPVCSPACSITFQIKTAPDNAGVPGEWKSTWCGPEGNDLDEDDYYTNATGTIIHIDHNGDNWVKYRALLTGDTKSTPILEHVEINYK